MSYDYITDDCGRLEIIVNRWYNKYGNRSITVYADGFEPYEPVSLEVIGEDDDSLARKPYSEVEDVIQIHS